MSNPRNPLKKAAPYLIILGVAIILAAVFRNFIVSWYDSPAGKFQLFGGVMVGVFVLFIAVGIIYYFKLVRK